MYVSIPITTDNDDKLTTNSLPGMVQDVIMKATIGYGAVLTT